MKNTILLFIALFASTYLFGQDNNFVLLQKNWNKLLNTDSEIEKDYYHKSLKGQLSNYISPSGGKKDLSQLENFKDLWSSDSSLRIVSYFFQRNEDDFVIGGALYCNCGQKVNGQNFIHTALLEEDSFKIRRDTTYSEQYWPAAWYYKIIEKENRFGQKYFTLIGWIPKNRISQQKIVDILWFKGEDIFFGAPLFEREGSREHRLLFEYGAQNTMRLSYQEEQDRIIMDHLSPPGAEYQGIYEYYGPDFSFDSFKWENDRWMYHPDVDVDEGIEKKKSDFKKKDKILEDKPIYTPNGN